MRPAKSPRTWAVLTLSTLLAGCRNEAPLAPTLESPNAQSKPQMRTYYVAADEVDWDYAPSGMNLATGQPFDDQANVFVENGPDRIGRVYTKARYREYTDATFGELKVIEPKWEHLGVLGPLLRAVVLDSVTLVFRNNTQWPLTVHVHGLQYLKDSEGTPGNDGTPPEEREDDDVPSGGTYTYKYYVPERSGPGPMDGSSVVWMYHSHVDEPSDTNSGLIGPILVTARGQARTDGSPRDVDREFVTLFTVFDENASRYLEQNIQKFCTAPEQVVPDDEGFQESNLMHSINGYVYGNLPGLTMRRGERVRWYLLSMGTEVDLHTPHWHGATVLLNGMRTDVLELLPMSMKIADMVPDVAGDWLFHCHVNDHIAAGMVAWYHVLEGQPASLALEMR